MQIPERGFTLVELLLAAAVAGILAAAAVAAVETATARTQLETRRGALHRDLVAAIRHATLFRQRVVVCPRGAGSACTAGSGWDAGWTAFVDADRDGEPSEGERVLLAREIAPRRYRVLASVGRDRLVIQPGGLTPGSNTRFRFCDPRGRSRPLQLVMANSGRLRTDLDEAGAFDCPRR